MTRVLETIAAYIVASQYTVVTTFKRARTSLGWKLWDLGWWFNWKGGKPRD
jgi:hypothetical protein